MGGSTLAGRRIIVTGGASGMGEGLVRGFAAMGAHVASLDLAAKVGADIAKQAGAFFVQVDVSDQESVVSGVEESVEELGGLDVLVNAAGIAPSAPAQSTSLELWNAVMGVNVTGTMLTNQAVFSHLKPAGGAILNFASAAGIVGLPNKAAYSASKGAVLAWTRTIAREWGRYGITANAIAPAIWTPMYEKTRAEMTSEQLRAHDEYAAQAIPIGGKLGDIVTDFLPVLAFYASTGAKFITGQTIAIDGGSLMVR
jgi:NAD(P)-dependent dehydrogenase (short-subunit alcohol dehydrogenase family)